MKRGFLYQMFNISFVSGRQFPTARVSPEALRIPQVIWQGGRQFNENITLFSSARENKIDKAARVYLWLGWLE